MNGENYLPDQSGGGGLHARPAKKTTVDDKNQAVFLIALSSRAITSFASSVKFYLKQKGINYSKDKKKLIFKKKKGGPTIEKNGC